MVMALVNIITQNAVDILIVFNEYQILSDSVQYI